MVKKVKFPLKLAGGSKVSTLEDLRKHFDLASVLSYYSSKRLTEWLRDRGYDEEADKINALDSKSAGFKQSFCEVFDIEYIADGTDDIDLADIAAKNERRERLKMFTADEKILALVDCVAFTQDDLTALLDNGVKEIYLCGGPFEITVSVENVTYIGVNYPKVNAPDGFWGKDIVFKNVDVGIEDIIRQAEEAPSSENATLWLMAAELGHVGAQYWIGMRYYYGKSNVEQSYEKAAIWLRKAAEQGHDGGQFELGACYILGQGVKQDDAEAVKWYRKSAEQGNELAQFELGVCHLYGQGVEENHYEAVEWFRKAAEQGNEFAQFELGSCYFSGQGVEENHYEAVEWLRKAAEQGNADAQFMLGSCYFSGQGVEKNHYEAVEWFRKAAEQGNANAQFHLGSCYDYGIGVNKDKEKAIKWYRKAAGQGNKDAITELNKIDIL